MPAEVVVDQRLTREEALNKLSALLEPKFEISRTLEDDELFFSRFPGTRVIAKVIPLDDGRTRFQVRADDVWWSPAVYGRLISVRWVGRAIQHALD